MYTKSGLGIVEIEEGSAFCGKSHCSFCFFQAPALEYYSGYKTSDLHPLVKQLNTLLTLRPCNKLKTVHSKYSHQ